MRNQIRFFYLKLAAVLLVSLVSYGSITSIYGSRASVCGVGDQLIFFLPHPNLPKTAEFYWVPPNLSNYRFICEDLPAGPLLSQAISNFPSALRILYPHLEIFLFDRTSATLRENFVSLRMENVGRGVWITPSQSQTPMLNLSQRRDDFVLPVSLSSITMAEGFLTADLRERASELRTQFEKTAFELSWLRGHGGQVAFLGRQYDGTPQMAECHFADTLICDHLSRPPPNEPLPQEDLSICDRALESQPPGVPDSNTYLCLTSKIAKLAHTCDPELSRFALRVSPYALPVVTTLKVARCLSDTRFHLWVDTAYRSTLKAGFFANN